MTTVTIYLKSNWYFICIQQFAGLAMVSNIIWKPFQIYVTNKKKDSVSLIDSVWSSPISMNL